jgi:hypothetical protein
MSLRGAKQAHHLCTDGDPKPFAIKSYLQTASGGGGEGGILRQLLPVPRFAGVSRISDPPLVRMKNASPLSTQPAGVQVNENALRASRLHFGPSAVYELSPHSKAGIGQVWFMAPNGATNNRGFEYPGMIQHVGEFSLASVNWFIFVCGVRAYWAIGREV